MAKPKPRIKKRKSRRKLGARAYKNYTQEMLQIAVESVASKIISSREAEKQFGIPRRTIINKLKNFHSKAVGAPTRLTAEEENKLISVIIASADYGSPLTKLDLRILVYNYLKKNGKEDLFNGKMPGEKWVNNLLSRHSEKLTVRSTQNISTSRAEKGEEEILNYFNNLRITLKGVPPSNILNYDETNCNDDPGSSKAIFRRGVKYPERIINSTKGCVSLMFSGTADGKCLPPYIVYKAEHLYNEWVLNGPKDARYNCTRSGWFDAVIFEDYFRTIVLEWAKTLAGPKVVIGDNLSSHLNPEIIQLCEEHDIKFVFLPPNATHLTQPLDIAFFGPLKKEWRKILLKYKTENPSQKTMNKKHFPALLQSLMDSIKMRHSTNLRSGFRAAGIYPLNPRQVLKRIPEFQFSDSTTYQIDETLLDYLKQSRASKPMKVARNKKIYVEPGKSVSVADFENKDLFQKQDLKNKNKGNKQNEKNSITTNEKLKSKSKQMNTNLINIKEHNTKDSENSILLEAKMGVLETNGIESLKTNEEKSNEDIIFKETGNDNITEYIEEVHNKKNRNKNVNIKMEVQHEDTIEKYILNEKTGCVQQFIVTTAIIEKPKPHILTENVIWTQNAHKDLERNKLEVFDDDIISDSKENIDNPLDNESIVAKMKLNVKCKRQSQKHLGKEIKNTPAKRAKKLRSTSTTTEEISFSVHSDSDLDGIELEDRTSMSSNSISSNLNDLIQEVDIEDDVKEIIDEREAEIFNEIMRRDAETDEDTKPVGTKTDCNEYEHSVMIQETEVFYEDKKNEEKLQTENEYILNCLKNDIKTKELGIGDNVLVRYYNRKKWKYYIGLITDVNDQLEKKYKISYYKTISKKGDIKFVKPNRPDIDLIPYDLIVKQVNLLQIKDKNEFVLFNNEDLIYF